MCFKQEAAYGSRLSLVGSEMWIRDSLREKPHGVGKFLGLVLGVVVFVQAGFEHCVANMFYFTVAGAWSGKTVLYLVVMTLGNAAGGVLFPLGKKLRARAEG